MNRVDVQEQMPHRSTIVGICLIAAMAILLCAPSQPEAYILDLSGGKCCGELVAEGHQYKLYFAVLGEGKVNSKHSHKIIGASSCTGLDMRRGECLIGVNTGLFSYKGDKAMVMFCNPDRETVKLLLLLHPVSELRIRETFFLVSLLLASIAWYSALL